MKFDKELVLKHKFWFLLVVTLPLSLGALFMYIQKGDDRIHLAVSQIGKGGHHHLVMVM